MNLYYWAGACSLSSHIVSREAALELQLAAFRPRRAQNPGWRAGRRGSASTLANGDASRKIAAVLHRRHYSQANPSLGAASGAASALLQKTIFNFCIDLMQPLFSALSLVLIRHNFSL